jgi:hypothetical protein
VITKPCQNDSSDRFKTGIPNFGAMYEFVKLLFNYSKHKIPESYETKTIIEVEGLSTVYPSHT